MNPLMIYPRPLEKEMDLSMLLCNKALGLHTALNLHLRCLGQDTKHAKYDCSRLRYCSGLILSHPETQQAHPVA